MAVVAKVYPEGMKNILNGTVDLVANTIKVALLDAHAYNAADENSATVLSASEIDDTDYTPGGETVTIVSGGITRSGEVLTVDTSLSPKESVFTSEGDISATQAVLYDSTAGKVLVHIDFGGTEESVAGEFKIVWHANGLFTVTTNPV